MAAKPELDIEIEGENYRLDTLPADNSSVVLAEKKKLLGTMDLKTLVHDLGRVGAFIRIAYNGVGAAGPKFTELQIEIKRMGYDVTRLCDKSALTVAKFKEASSTVLTHLQATYEYLLDNLEEMAVETLFAVSKLAGEMEKAALELHHDFEQQVGKVQYTTEGTHRAWGKEALQSQELQKQFEDPKQEQMKVMEDAQLLQREAEAGRRQIEEKEEAISGIGSNNPFKLLANASMIGIGKVFDENESEKKAAHWKERRVEALQVENKFRHEALGKKTDFATKTKDYPTEENMTKVAVDALHHLIGALNELSILMRQTAQFCHSLADSEMQIQMEKAMKLYSDEKRRKVWTSNGFKIKAIHFYAGWVAFHSVCSVYIEQIEETQKDLREYLKENPTWEESRKNVKSLAETFLSDLKQDQKAIADKEFSSSGRNQGPDQ